MRAFVKENTWLPGISRGWGNGYIVLPNGHPMHGKDYDTIHAEMPDLSVHYGLTFSESVSNLDWDELKDEDKGGWVVGFDTAHWGDDIYKWPKIAVEAEAIRLLDQFKQ